MHSDFELGSLAEAARIADWHDRREADIRGRLLYHTPRSVAARERMEAVAATHANSARALRAGDHRRTVRHEASSAPADPARLRCVDAPRVSPGMGQ